MIPLQPRPQSRTSASALLNTTTGFIYHLHQSKRSCGEATCLSNYFAFRSNCAVVNAYTSACHKTHGAALHQLRPAFSTVFRAHKQTVVNLMIWATSGVEVSTTWDELSVNDILRRLFYERLTRANGAKSMLSNSTCYVGPRLSILRVLLFHDCFGKH